MTNQKASGDICPAGWHLPIGGDSSNINNSEFAQLDIALGGTGGTGNAAMSRIYRNYPNNFIYSGSIDGSSIQSRNTYGDYWSPNAAGVSYAHAISISSTNVYPGTANSGRKYFGKSVRCLAGS